MIHETELQTRLRRAKEALAYARDEESQARDLLRSAEESRRRAKEKYDALFLGEEQAEVQRRNGRSIPTVHGAAL